MLLDPALQMALPYGLATSNRIGGQGTVTAGFKDFVEVQGLVTVLSQVKPVIGFEAVKYMEYGGGAKADIFKAIGFSKPLEISGSYKHSERTADFDEKEAGVGGSAELKSDFINAGFYVQYLPRLGVTAGLQMVNTEYNDLEAATSGFVAPMLKSKQMQWMVGLDYAIEKYAWLAINFGIISVANEYNSSALVAANAAGEPLTTGTAGGVYNIPDYYDVSKDKSGKYKNEFTQTIIEASLNVEF
jgi:hypothetical protein